MNVLIWHVHGAWTTAFVRGRHRYFVPLVPDRGPDGRGRAQTYCWPETVVELSEADAASVRFDAVVFQRPEELRGLGARWLGTRRPGRDFAAIYVEHDAPTGHPNDMRHPVADRDDLTLVHVTHFNDLFWDAGTTRRRVIEHGIVAPDADYDGSLPRTAVVINEAARRKRMTGTDLLPAFATVAPIDLFGIDAASLGGVGDLPQARLHEQVALRRAYVHPFRWTSLGLALLEAMAIGVPVVALATTDVVQAVPPHAGFCSTNVSELVAALARLHAEPDVARAMGRAARAYAYERYNLDRFLSDWDDLFAEVLA